MRMNRKEFSKDEGRRGQQRLKAAFSTAIKNATTLKEDKKAQPQSPKKLAVDTE